MKKIFTLLMSVLLVAGLMSCNEKGGNVAAATGDVKAIVDSMSMTLGDLMGGQMKGQISMTDSTIDFNKVYATAEQTMKSPMSMIEKADTSNHAATIGMQIGMQLIQMHAGFKGQFGVGLNSSLFMKHLQAALTAATAPDQQAMMQGQASLQGLETRLTEAILANNPEVIKNKQDGEKYMATLKDYTKTASGLAYKVVKEGAGENFKDGDVVMVKYVGKHINGEEFDNSKDEAVPFPLNGVVKGFAEMLKLMKPGEKVIAVLPGDIAYGVQGNPQGGIGRSETLVFEMEAVGVQENKAPATAAPKVNPNASAKPASAKAK